MTLSRADRAVHAKDVAALEPLRARIRRLQLRAGMRLARIRSKASFLLDGTVSFAEFAEKRGFCAGEASILAAAAEAPALHAGLLRGRTCPDKVASVGRVLRGPSLVRPDDDWARLARAVDTLVVLMGLRGLPHIVSDLLAHGRSADTPVALIRWGTTAAQRTVLGTLGDIVARARGAGLEPPVLIVIGDVVRLRERLDWFESRGGGLDAGREGAGRCPAIVSR